MATVPGSRSGAGGKIVTSRRKQRISNTPYDRPEPQQPPRKSPNWFSGVIIPSARALASGAGKIISAVMYSESDSESSSEDEDLASDDSEVPPDRVDASNEENVTSSGHWTETKRLIEQLIMQETFSRAECDRLTKVLNSRVMDISNEDVNIFHKAVVEAKKWLQEKKAGSSSSAELTHGTFNLHSTRPEHLESETGSPVNVARSYMKDRPVWTSPTKNIEIRTPLKITSELSKKGNSFASGSWNIHEELRKVRSKATEDMLRTPSSKFDRSLFSNSPIRHESASVNLYAGVSSDPALAALESIRDLKASEAVLSKPAACVFENNEDAKTVQINGESATAKLTNPTSLNHAVEHSDDPNSGTIGFLPENELTEFDETQNVNGFSSSQASLRKGARVGQNTHEENHTASGTKLEDIIIIVEEKCELLSESHVEVPIATETDSIASGSQNSLNEELLNETTRPITKGKVIVGAKQQGNSKPGKVQLKKQRKRQVT